MAGRRGADGKMLRGTSNTNVRGSAHQRRRRKLWMLEWFGDGVTAPCYSCAAPLHYEILQADRIIPGVLGGSYARGNIRPACGDCNRRGGLLVRMLIKNGISKAEIIRRCRIGQ